MKPLYDPHFSYSSPDEQDTTEFTKFHPIWKGLAISAGIGFGAVLLVILFVVWSLW